MSVAINWDNKMHLAKCDIMVGFPISSHILSINQDCSVRVYRHILPLHISGGGKGARGARAPPTFQKGGQSPSKNIFV